MAMTILYEVGKNLYVNITNKCPCSCTFCIRNNADGAYGSDSLWLDHDPSEQEILDAFEKYDLNKYEEIVFCGYGEPTERLDVMTSVIGKLKEKSCPIVRLNTNGLSDLIHGEPTAHKLKGYVDIVSISLNAGTKEEYLAVTRPKFGEASYEAMHKFALDCKQYVPKIILSVVDVIGEEEIAASKAVADKLGIPLRVRKYDC